jgi:hypothetical protein
MDALVTRWIMLPPRRGLERGRSVADARDEAQIGGPSPEEQAGAVGSPNRWAVLGLVALGTFMTTLDASIVNISVPSIARTFQTPIGGAVEWVIIAYLTVVAASLLTFGRLSDAIGRKPVWEAGLASFTLGSVLCGAAGTLPMLIIARAFQGLGGALIFAPSFAIITEAFSPTDRGRALGLNSVVIAVATSLGPTLGALITAHLTWRWIFYVNVPLGVLGLLAARRLLPGGTTRSREPLDGPGAALFAVGLACLTLSLSLGQEWGWALRPASGMCRRRRRRARRRRSRRAPDTSSDRRLRLVPQPCADVVARQHDAGDAGAVRHHVHPAVLLRATPRLLRRGVGIPAHAAPPHDHGDRAPERIAGRSLRFALARVERAGARLPGSLLAVPTGYRQHRRRDRRGTRADRPRPGALSVSEYTGVHERRTGEHAGGGLRAS